MKRTATEADLHVYPPPLPPSNNKKKVKESHNENEDKEIAVDIVKLVEIAGDRLKLRITNVTTTAWLGVTVNLTDISNVLICMYDRKRFPNCVYQSKYPKCTILIYESGKIVTIGTKTPEYAQTAIYLLVLKLYVLLPHTMWESDVYNFRVVNNVGSFCTGFLLDLPRLHQENRLSGKATYNKNHFPAARYKTSAPLPVTTLTVFKSGRVNIAGAKTPKDLSLVYNSLKNMKQYKLQ